MPTFAVNNASAMSLWNAGLISAANAPVSANWLQTSPMASDPDAVRFKNQPWSVCRPILANLATKGGYNAIRVFLDFADYTTPSGGTEHDLTTVARLGWFNNTIRRNTTRDYVIPRFDLLAAQIDNLLTVCQSLGMGVILCPGIYHSGEGGELWNRADLQANLVSFWSATAKRWAAHPALIAYEILNEPQPGRYPTDVNGSRAMPYSLMRVPGSLNNYRELMERCCKAIRSFDTVTPVMVSSIHCGSMLGLEYFSNAPDGSSQLVRDTTASGTVIDRVVYTCHFYNPFRYTHQGIHDGCYQATGLCYPNFVSRELEHGDGVIRINSYDYRPGGAADGMSKAFAPLVAFKAAYKKPVFIGEFSAVSSTYLRTLSNHPNYPGASPYVPPGAGSRRVVGLGYDSSRREGVLVFSQAICLYDFTEVDPQGRQRSRNRVNLQIQASDGSPATRSQIDAFADTGLLQGVVLDGGWYPPSSSTSAGGDENFVARFAWPAGVPTPSRNVGVSHLNPDGSERTPAQFRALFAAGYPAQVASIKLVLSTEQIKAQEASRVLFARDVLRQCAQTGSSWAWFTEYETVDAYPYGDKFWQVDNRVDAATGVGGKLRAVLRRATQQLYV